MLGSRGSVLGLLLVQTAACPGLGSDALGAVQSHGAPPASATVSEGTIPVAVLADRRARLLAGLEPGIAAIRGADPWPYYFHPTDTDFRQDNDFYYLTGLETPRSWLVAFKSAEGPDSVVLFVPARDPEEERWTGPRIGAGPEVAERTGVPTVRPAAEFEAEFLERLKRPGALSEYMRVLVRLGRDLRDERQVVDAAMETRRGISDLGEHLARLRLVKDSVELHRLRRAIEITGAAHSEGMRRTRPGMYEYQLEAVVEYEFHHRGAERPGFPSIVGSGPNSVILHYDSNRRRMEAGDLVVVDIGAEYAYYTADLTRTYPVSGTFTQRQRDIYELVLATQQAAIDSVRPGRTVRELNAIARRYMKEHSNGLCGEQSCDAHFVHGLSHWLGMDVHDVGSYATPLAPGMVLTIEPGIYLPDENLGVRIEDDVLVTADGREVLSTGTPRTVSEIEAVMAEGAAEILQ